MIFNYLQIVGDATPTPTNFCSYGIPGFILYSPPPSQHSLKIIWDKKTCLPYFNKRGLTKIYKNKMILTPQIKMTTKMNKTYDIIYADPPWRYEVSEGKNYGKNAFLSHRIENEYNTMSLDEI
jgi:hypothetical protein